MLNVTEISIVNSEGDSAVGIKTQNKENSRQAGGLLNKSTIILSHGIQKKKSCFIGQLTSVYQYQG
jgi:hypothetical protein